MQKQSHSQLFRNNTIKKNALARASLLSHQDSNLGKQNQNLMCYHYTMGQSLALDKKRVQKYQSFSNWPNLFSSPLIISTIKSQNAHHPE